MRNFCHILGILTFIALSVLIAPTAKATPQSIKVVMDDAYPPYSFKNNDGMQQGILIDQWRLWEQKTGIKVEIHAMDWGKALNAMEAGEFDVIDTIFQTPQRSKWLDFTSPYAKLEVPIFFDKDISGITNAASLRGFAVAVKKGDDAVDVLKRNSVDNLLFFDSYEAIIQAAKEHKVNVFVIDKPPALYFLYKLNVYERFNYSAPLNVGQFHRAVHKDNAELLHLIENGFSKITPEELKRIETRWVGAPIVNQVHLYYLLVFFISVILVFLALFLWNRVLHSAVQVRTAELMSSLKALELTRFSIEHASDALFWIAPDASIIDVNEAACRSLSYTRDELLQLTVPDFDIHYTSQNWSQHFNELRKTGSLKFESEQRSKNGHIFPVEIVANYIKLDSEEHNCAFVRDITERKKIEAALLKAKDDAVTASKAKSEFLNNIAHDFRTPMHAIMGFSNILEASGLNDKQKKYVDIINEKSQSLLGLVEDLLDVSRLESGKLELRSTKINIQQCVTTAVEHARAELGAKEIAVTSSIDNNIPLIKGDEIRLNQILSNLIGNAVKYTNEGRISVSVEQLHYDHPEQGKCRVKFSIKDTGLGIPKDKLSEIFDPFTRFHEFDGNKERSGVGLGLYITKTLTDLMKGNLSVQSEVGIGSEFIVILDFDNA